MKNLNPIESHELFKKMRKGEKVECPLCEKGIMLPVGDYKTTHCFTCSNCEKKWNIN